MTHFLLLIFRFTSLNMELVNVIWMVVFILKKCLLCLFIRM